MKKDSRRKGRREVAHTTSRERSFSTLMTMVRDDTQAPRTVSAYIDWVKRCRKKRITPLFQRNCACGHSAMYGWPEDRRRLVCRKHALAGMVDLASVVCEFCDKKARKNPDGSRTCATHRPAKFDYMKRKRGPLVEENPREGAPESPAPAEEKTRRRVSFAPDTVFAPDDDEPLPPICVDFLTAEELDETASFMYDDDAPSFFTSLMPCI